MEHGYFTHLDSAVISELFLSMTRFALPEPKKLVSSVAMEQEINTHSRKRRIWDYFITNEGTARFGFNIFSFLAFVIGFRLSLRSFSINNGVCRYSKYSTVASCLDYDMWTTTWVQQSSSETTEVQNKTKKNATAHISHTHTCTAESRKLFPMCFTSEASSLATAEENDEIRSGLSNSKHQ